MADLSSAEIAHAVRAFGEARSADGDTLVEERQLEAFLYTSGQDHAGIAVSGTQFRWRISVFAAARIRMRPSLDLHRRVSAWRTTFPVGAPYVIESCGEATVLCERSYDDFQLTAGFATQRLISSTVDIVSQSASLIGHDLVDHGGAAFTGNGVGGLLALHSWWEVTDERIGRIVG